MRVEAPLLKRVPSHEEKAQVTSELDLILDRFLDFIHEKQIDLYPAQEEAILELFSGKNVILNTPTGSGKSLVATAVHFDSLCSSRRSIYTCPIKALVNEKFLALCRDFGPEQVGMITGDASVNPSAPILCCTAEILAIDALKYGSETPIGDVIMDEFHYYSDRDRGMAWQIPLLTLCQSRFLLMSATLGDTEFFEKKLTELNGRQTVTVRSTDRPVPLEFEYSEIPLHETLTRLIEKDRAPVYLVCFTQRDCAEAAQNLLSVDFSSKEEKRRISESLENFRFTSPYGKEIQKLLKHGLGLHHAGLLPKYRVQVESLAQRGLLKVICGTDTLGVGVNVPIRTVLLTQLCKFDGSQTKILSVRDFQQISGRAGRKGFDEKGYVVAQAPGHLIENLRMEQKAANDSKKLKKIAKKKPPDKGYVPWNKETFLKLIQSQPEPLISRFQVSHSMLLHVLSRKNGSGCKAMKQLIRSSHESPHSKRHHRKTAFQLLRSLVERKIIELNPLRLNLELQEDFSLNHTLSLYLIDTIRLLDPTDPEYALDLLTLVESILENPDLILRKQLDQIKSEKIEEMKREGIEYEDRLEKLEELEYPKPNRDFIYDTFNDFAKAHPWVGSENIKPKSVAREMYEKFYSFSDYIKEYKIQRSEGLLLRYLSDVYKTLVQTVPEMAKNEEVFAIEVFFGTLLRQIDSSLLDEWEKLKNPQWVNPKEHEDPFSELQKQNMDITRNEKNFIILVRNEIFRFVRSLAASDYSSALELLDSLEREEADAHSTWTPELLEAKMKSYFDSDHSRICTDTKARHLKYTQIKKSESNELWKVEQILVDPDEHNDWSIQFLLDFAKSKKNQRICLKLIQVSDLSESFL